MTTTTIKQTEDTTIEFITKFLAMPPAQKATVVAVMTGMEMQQWIDSKAESTPPVGQKTA
jgi:hypothetical protein